MIGSSLQTCLLLAGLDHRYAVLHPRGGLPIANPQQHEFLATAQVENHTISKVSILKKLNLKQPCFLRLQNTIHEHEPSP